VTGSVTFKVVATGFAHVIVAVTYEFANAAAPESRSVNFAVSAGAVLVKLTVKRPLASVVYVVPVVLVAGVTVEEPNTPDHVGVTVTEAFATAVSDEVWI